MKFIAIDWDGTYTESPELWQGFIRSAHECGKGKQFRCFFVTARHPCEEVQKEANKLGIEAIFTGGYPKMKFARDFGADIHIWIDDMPELIFSEAKE